jgi:hypothetical protein
MSATTARNGILLSTVASTGSSAIFGLVRKAGLALPSQAMRGGVRLDFERAVQPFIGPQELTKPLSSIIDESAEVLLAHVGDLLAVLAVAGLVNEQRPGDVGGRLRIFEPEFELLRSLTAGG